MKKKIFFLTIITIMIFSCKKESINPYNNNDLKPPIGDTSTYFNDPTNFASIYSNIFLPYCANSGCHDGSFEPDFRSIESSYNTLVYHPVTKNNDLNTFQYRVKPGFVTESVLYARLLADLNGTALFDDNSQVMPLTADIAYDPNQENIWHTEKSIYIENIKNWIENGALDMYGHSPSIPNNKPEMKGVIAFASGNTSNSFNRDGSRGTIIVPQNINTIDIWFAISDDLLPTNELTYNKIKISDNFLSFENKPEQQLSLVSQPLLAQGYYLSETVEYYHYFTYDVSNLTSGDERFIKIYVKDDTNPLTEIPSNGSSYQVIRHFTFEIQ